MQQAYEALGIQESGNGRANLPCQYTRIVMSDWRWQEPHVWLVLLVPVTIFRILLLQRRGVGCVCLGKVEPSTRFHGGAVCLPLPLSSGTGALATPLAPHIAFIWHYRLLVIKPWPLPQAGSSPLPTVELVLRLALLFPPLAS